MNSDVQQHQTNHQTIEISTDSGATARILPYGAHLVSWRPAHNQREHLFMSEKANFSPGKAIRGGVPVIFPQFASRGPLPKHGFARVRPWDLVSHGPVDGNLAKAVFRLVSDDDTRALWPHDFTATYTVLLSDNQLDMELRIDNSGAEALSFTAGLHTYFAVGDVRGAKLHGLAGSYYQDDGVGEPQLERRETMTFAGHVDRVYRQTQAPLRLKSPVQTTRIAARGFPDTVVWNPGPELSQRLKDMTDQGYEAMLCVEAAAVNAPIALEPGESWTGHQILTSE